MFFFRRPNKDLIKQLLLKRHDMNFSYPHTEATRSSSPPLGWRINHMRVRLGTGRGTHEHAVAALFSWSLLSVASLEVFSQAPRVRPQAEVAMLSRHLSIWSLDFCRVIYVLHDVSENHGSVLRTGFGYGTLPGHAVRGEERFSIEWHPRTEEVWYDIYSFSQPSSLFVQLLTPIAVATQKSFAHASLKKAARIALYGLDRSET